MAKKDTKNSFLSVCPICRNKLKINDSNAINNRDFSYLYCVECRVCLSFIMLAVFPMKDGVVTTMGMLTDLQKKDIDLIKDSEFITEDNVLALYDYINNSSNSNKKT
ncbi:MAG: hypothetical protein AAB614_02370 [Patescibacteria group bacterium]